MTAFISATAASRLIASENRFPRGPGQVAGRLHPTWLARRQQAVVAPGHDRIGIGFPDAEEEQVVIEILDGGGGGVDRHRTGRERLAPYDLALLGGSNERRRSWRGSRALRLLAGSTLGQLALTRNEPLHVSAQMPLKALCDFVSCRLSSTVRQHERGRTDPGGRTALRPARASRCEDSAPG